MLSIESRAFGSLARGMVRGCSDDSHGNAEVKLCARKASVIDQVPRK